MQSLCYSSVTEISQIDNYVAKNKSLVTGTF